MQKALLLSALLIMAGPQAIAAQQTIDTSIFPKPGTGMTQHVFTLPTHEHENKYRIEIVAGKTVLADCNNIMISADLEHEDLAGWGYPYFEIEDVSRPASTMMACPSVEKTEKVIELNLGKDALIRYNSQVPLVIYAPKEIQVGYRVWQTDGAIHHQSK